MSEIPGWLLRHTITVRTRLGSGGRGDVFGDPVDLPAFVDDKRSLVRDATTGEQIVASATVYLAPAAYDLVPPGSLVVVNGRETAVISTQRADGGGLPTPDHVAITLQ